MGNNTIACSAPGHHRRISELEKNLAVMRVLNAIALTVALVAFLVAVNA